MPYSSNPSLVPYLQNSATYVWWLPKLITADIQFYALVRWGRFIPCLRVLLQKFDSKCIYRNVSWLTSHPGRFNDKKYLQGLRSGQILSNYRIRMDHTECYVKVKSTVSVQIEAGNSRICFKDQQLPLSLWRHIYNLRTMQLWMRRLTCSSIALEKYV